MGFYPITVNTAPEAEAHIFAEDDAAIYQAIFGEDCVFDIGDKLKSTVLSNNKIRIGNGVICVGGHIGRNKYGDYEELEIENGVVGKKRNDLIVARFATTGTGGIDTFTLNVKKGAAGTTAVDPDVTKGNLYEGAQLREFPLYRIKIEGLSIIEVEQLFAIRKTGEQLQSDVNGLNGEITKTNKQLQSDVNRLNGEMGKKQNNFALGHNTIKNLDSLFVGCTWYNADQNPTGTKPFNTYGYIIAFQSANTNYVQIAIPYGNDTYDPKWRTHVNGTWQQWRMFNPSIIDNLNDVLANTTSGKIAGALALKSAYNGLNSGLANSLRFKGAIPSTNLDSITTPGIYSIDGQSLKISWTNGGAAAIRTYQLWGNLIVLPYYKTQILITPDFVIESSSPCLAIRFYMGNPLAWTYWKVLN